MYPGPMTSPGRGRGRAVRSGTLALAVVALAAAGHRVGGGELPSPPILVGLVLATAAPAAALTARRLRWPTLLATLGAGQGVLHVALGALAAPAALGMPVTPGTSITPGTPVMPAVHSHAWHGLPGSADSGSAMTLAHVLATVATAILLAWGERALWAAWERVRPRPLPACLELGPGPRRQASTGRVPSLRGGVAGGLPFGRAPPVLS